MCIRDSKHKVTTTGDRRAAEVHDPLSRDTRQRPVEQPDGHHRDGVCTVVVASGQVIETPQARRRLLESKSEQLVAQTGRLVEPQPASVQRREQRRRKTLLRRLIEPIFVRLYSPSPETLKHV